MSHIYDEVKLLCYKIDELLRFKELSQEEYGLLDQADKLLNTIVECKGDWVHVDSNYMDWEKSCSQYYGYNDAINDVVDILEKENVSVGVILKLDSLRLNPKDWGVE